MITYFGAKRVSEVQILAFDFGALLGESETLIAAAMAATIVSGSGAPTLQGAANIAGATVAQLIGGGVAGSLYQIDCTVDTSAGQRLVSSGQVTIRP
jgi:polyisoprenoid-binding protein YceI